MRPAILIILAFLTLAAGPSKADNLPILYHSTGDTFGCADPAATISLTDPNETRRKNAAWVKSAFNDGHCVSITPKSPWRFVSRAGDVALMDYAGTVGPPGSYYMRIDQLVDATGHHPADPNAPADAPAAPSTVDAASATALAPTTQAQMQQQVAPPAPVLTSASAPAQPTWTTGDIVLLLVALALAATGGYVMGRRR